MPDPETVRRALDSALQSLACMRLGPLGEMAAHEAESAWRDSTAAWDSADRDRVRAAAGELDALHRDSDRARNHFMKNFRAAHGADRAAWSPAEKAEFDAGIAEHTRKKLELTERVVEELTRGRLAKERTA